MPTQQSNCGKIIVFAGNTVMSQALAKALPEAASRLVHRPPAGLGDVWRHIRDDVSSMVVIDCRHGDAPSVWHREIRSAFNAGIAIFGAGGIGALRAAELCNVGMVGVGKVFERIQNGLLEADDEVLSGPDGFALVTFRMVLEEARETGVMTPVEMQSLESKVRSCFHARRTWSRAGQWVEDTVSPEHREAVVSFIKRHAVDPRLDDAITAIRLALSDVKRVDSIQYETNPMTEMFGPKWRLSEIYCRSFVVNGKEISGAAVLERAHPLRDAWGPCLRNAFFVRQWLKEQQITPSPGFVENSVRKAISEKGDTISSFLIENGMTLLEWKRLLERKSLVTWAQRKRSTLLPDLPDEYCFAEAWAQTHGVIAAKGDKSSAGRMVVEKGPARYGLAWEEPVAFLDALRVSGRAAHFARLAAEGDALDA